MQTKTAIMITSSLVALFTLTTILPAAPAQAIPPRAVPPILPKPDGRHTVPIEAEHQDEHPETERRGVSASPLRVTAVAAQAGEAVDSGAWDQAHPSAVTDSAGTTCAMWENYRKASPHVRFAERPQGGEWQPSLQLNPTASGDQTSPRIAAASSGNLYAIREDYRGEESQTRFAYRQAGDDWGVSEPVSPTVEHVRHTAIGERREPLDVKVAVDGEGSVHAVWDDRRSGDTNHQIYAAYRTVDGSWSVNVRIDDGVGSVVERVDYDPFGTPSFSGGGLGQQTSPNIGDRSLLGNLYLFRDGWHDAESGLSVDSGRRYDPMIGRYLKRGAEALGNPYTFAHNNPLRKRR